MARPKAKPKTRAGEESKRSEDQYRRFLETARELAAEESGRPFHDVMRAMRRRRRDVTEG